MSIFEAIVLGVVQGLTEFLPISSSGHLVLFESWFALDVEKLRSFDVVVHVGTLLAILIYFRNDFAKIIRDVLSGRFRMAVLLALGTIPAVIVGFLLGDLLDELFRDARTVAYTLIIFSLVFFIAEKFPKEKKYEFVNDEKLLERTGRENPKDFLVALFIGVLQALALIPGVSRSGATISAGSRDVPDDPEAVFEYALGRGWSDGLPLIPPTPERVDDLGGIAYGVSASGGGTIFVYLGFDCDFWSGSAHGERHCRWYALRAASCNFYLGSYRLRAFRLSRRCISHEISTYSYTVCVRVLPSFARSCHTVYSFVA